MNYARKAQRNLEILDYRKTHTRWETALKFDLSVRQIDRIEKRLSPPKESPQPDAIPGQP